MICNSQHKKKHPEEACIVLSDIAHDYYKKDWTNDLREDYGYAQYINTNWWDPRLVYKKLEEIYDDMKSHPEVKNIHFILDTHGGKKKDLSFADMSSFNFALSSIKEIMQQRANVKLYFDNWACYDADYVDIYKKSLTDIGEEHINIYENMIEKLGDSLADRTYCKSIENNLIHHTEFIPFANPYKNVAHFGFDGNQNYHLYNSFQYFPLKDYKNRHDRKFLGYYGGQKAKNKFLGKEEGCGCGIF